MGVNSEIKSLREINSVIMPHGTQTYCYYYYYYIIRLFNIRQNADALQ